MRLPRDVLRRLHLALRMKSEQQMKDNIHWIRQAGKNKLVVGSQARILYADCEGRTQIAAAFNEAIKSGRSYLLRLSLAAIITMFQVPILLTAKHQIFMTVHHFTADMAIQNVIGDGFRGATWVSIHNGGGVGWGEVINGGFGMVLDGSADTDRRLRSMLHWDVNNGIARRAWARNNEAIFAINAMEGTRSEGHIAEYCG